MAQPGREANAPWSDESQGASSSSSASSAPQPIVLSGAEGLSLNTQMQGQMPTQATPAAGATLTGSVGEIDSSVWTPQVHIAGKGSILKGIGSTCLFGIVMMLVPMLMVGYAESSWEDDWNEETLNIDWDEGGLNGTFQLSHTPIDECSLSIRDGSRWSESFNAYDNCDGDGALMQYKESTIAQFAVDEGEEILRATFEIVNESTGEANFTVFALDYESANDSVMLDLHWTGSSEFEQAFDENLTPLIFTVNSSNWAEPCPRGDALLVTDKLGPLLYMPTDSPSNQTDCYLTYTNILFKGEFTVYSGELGGKNNSISLSLPEQDHQNLGTQTFDENLTPLIFPVYTNYWNQNNYDCAQEIRIEYREGTYWSYPQYEQWGYPPNCPNMTYYKGAQVNIGSIDHDSGFGEIYLDEPLGDEELEAEYWVQTGFEIGSILQCFAPLIAFALFVIWIVQVVRAFQAGLTNQGTGMLIGIIPAFFVSIILTFAIGIMLFGF
tara:strand:+ start:144 stop:1628 length:1485 start_codon:yes stop_codon:yes gene_type:complete